MADYKISLGVDVRVNDIRDRIRDYNTNSNNAKLKLGVKLDTDDIKRQINKLNLNGTSGKKGVAIPINTQSLESSLKEVKSIITDIKTSIGSLDSGAGMKSLLSSINQISTALDKASGQFAELNAELKSLSSKDFSINLGINTGGSNSPIARNTAYGNKVRNETLPQLKQQAEALEKYLDQYYKVKQRQEGIVKLTQGTNLFSDFWEMSQNIGNSKDSLANQISTYKKYISLIKDAAKIKGVDLDPVTSGFSKSADQLVADAQDIQSGAKEAEQSFEKLKQIFGSSGSGIDADGLSAQLDSIVADLSEIRTVVQSLSSGTSLDGLIASFDKLSNSIELLVNNCTNMKAAINDSVGGFGGSVGDSSGGIRNVENDLRQVTVTANSTSDAIKSIRNAMSSMEFNTSSIDAVTNDLKEMNVVIREVTAKKGKNFDITIKGVNELGEAVTVIKRLDDVTGKFGIISTQISKPFDEGVQAAKRFKKEAELVKKIKFNLGDDGNFETTVQNIESNAKRLSKIPNELQDDVIELRQLLKDMTTADTSDDVRGLVDSYKKFSTVLESVENQLEQINIARKDAAREEKAINDAAKLEQNKAKLSLQMQNWLKDNSAAAKDFGARIQELQRQLQSCDGVQLDGIKREFQNITQEAKLAGKTTQTFGDKIKTQFQKYSAYFGVAELFMYAEQGLRDMFDQVVAIDTAMTELKKVTDESDASYNQFLSNAASRAKEIGTTIDGLVTSTADFARLGYSFEESQGLAEVANIYTVVGDEIDGVEGATSSLISTLAAFKDEMNGMSDSDFAMSIVDKFNEVSNNFAISSGGIGEAMSRSASSLAAANNTLDESIALITAANEVTQNPEKVGKWLCRLKKWLYRLNS